eukprot:g32414.t1
MFPPSGEHFSGQGHSASDLQVTIFQGELRDTQQCRVAKQRLIAKFSIHEDGLNRDLGFMSHYRDGHVLDAYSAGTYYTYNTEIAHYHAAK